MTTQSCPYSPLVLALATTLFAGCGEVKEIRGELDDFNDRLAKMQDMVDKNWQATIQAFPGERYLQLIDALHGPDGPEKDAARRFLISLGNLRREDLSSEWVVSVWATWQGEGNVRVDAAPPAQTKGRVYVEQLVENGFKPAITQGLEALSRPRTEAEIREALNTRADELFDGLRGKYKFSGSDRAPTQFWVTDSVLNGPEALRYRATGERYGTQTYSAAALELATVPHGIKKTLQDQRKDDRERFRELLTSVVLTPIETTPLEVASRRFEEPWDVLASRQTLHVVVSEQDWKRVGGVDVRVRLHKRGDVDYIHPASREVSFDRSEFTRADHQPVEDGNPQLGSYLWASVSLIDLPRLLNREGFEELRQFYESQEDWDSLQKRAGQGPAATADR